MPVETAEVRPVRVGETLRSNFLLLAVLGAVGLSLGVVAAQRDKQTHTATTSILVSPLTGNPFYPSSRGEQLINLNTEAQALRSNTVAARVAETLGSDASESSLLADVRVAVPPNTQILEVTYSARSEEVALANSQSFADAYLDTRSQRAQNLINEQTEQLDQQIEDRRDEIEVLAEELTDSNTTLARTNVVEQRMDALATEASALSTTLAELASIPLDPGQVVTPAAIDNPGPFGALLWPVAGALVGVLGGFGLALLRLRADIRIRDVEAARQTGLSVIGTVVGADLDDEYRRIRVAILALEKRRPFALLVSGASEAAQGPACVVDLATSFARSGLDAIVIDATVHGDGPTMSLTAGSNTGVAEVLLGDASFADAVEDVEPRLRAMPAGEHILGVTDLLTGDNMAMLLASVKSNCDVLLLAGDSLQHGSAQSLASMVDAVVVETHQDVTTRPELERVMHTMELLPTSLLGTIFVGKDARQRTKTFQRPTALVPSQLSDGSQSELDARDVDASTAHGAKDIETTSQAATIEDGKDRPPADASPHDAADDEPADSHRARQERS